MGHHRSSSSKSPVRERRSPCRRSPLRKSPRQVTSPAHHRSSLRDSGSSPLRERSSQNKKSLSHRGRSPEKEKHSSHAKSPKRGSSLSPASPSPSPRSKRLKRAQAERENEKVKGGDPERNYSRGKERNSERERVSERESEKETDKARGRELERSQSRGKERNPEHERVLHREAERETEKVTDRGLERTHNRGRERNPERERASDREKAVEKERGRERGMERETAGDKREKQSGRDQTNGKSSRGRYEHSTSPSDRHQRRKHRSRSPLLEYDTRNGEEVMNSRGSDQRNGNDDSVAQMKAAEAALQAKQKPSFELSGKLAEETNRVRGVTLLFNEPPEARKPDVRWRLYVFKAGEVLNEPLYIHRQSCYLFGRERRVADVPTDHPSCSKQHAVIQFRLVEKEQPDGMTSKQPRVCAAARELRPVTDDGQVMLYVSALEEHGEDGSALVLCVLITMIVTKNDIWYSCFLLLPFFLVDGWIC